MNTQNTKDSCSAILLTTYSRQKTVTISSELNVDNLTIIYQKYFCTLNHLQIYFCKDPKWPTYLENTSTEMWSFLCPEEFTYFEGWCYSLRNASDFVEADCSSLNSTMVSEPDYKVNYLIAGKFNTLLLMTKIFGDNYF